MQSTRDWHREGAEGIICVCRQLENAAVIAASSITEAEEEEAEAPLFAVIFQK